MKRIVASTRYLALAGVFFGLLAALTAFAWGGVKTILIVLELAHGELDGMAVGLVQVMDGFEAGVGAALVSAVLVWMAKKS